MNFLLASLAWLVISILLGAGILLAVYKGVFWFLGLVIIAFVIAVWRIGCKAH